MKIHICLQRKMLAIAALLCASFFCLAQETAEEDTYPALRAAARERARHVIFNNDGCDILYFPKHLEVTKENFLARRTTYLAGRCDTLMYCPVAAGQGHFTLPLEGADFLRADPPSADCRNIAGPLADRGDDYFQWLVDFCHANRMELFFSFRFNDTHDSNHRPDKPNFFFCKWKDEHRDLLFGIDHLHNPRNAWWTAVDYTHPECRDRQLQLVQAVLDKYDVDGIDLDFSRYLSIFVGTANGRPATPEELEMMNDLMRRIRAVLDAKGRERGKGLLLSVVLPASVEICRNKGYDMETWLREGLIDIWQEYDGGHIDTTAAIAALAHRYGVKYYAFTGSPWPFAAQEKGSLMERRRQSAYDARVHTALANGADGLYLYNIVEPREFMRITDTDMGRLAAADKRYFLTDGGWEIPRGHCYSPEDYVRTRQLSVWVKNTVAPDYSQQFLLEIGETPETDDDLIGVVDVAQGDPKVVTVASNGIPWEPLQQFGRYASFRVPPEALAAGRNVLTLGTQEAPEDAQPLVFFAPKKTADFESGFMNAAERQALKSPQEDVFQIDPGTADGNPVFVKRFGNEEYAVVDFCFTVEVVDKAAPAVTWLTNAGYTIRLQIHRDRVELPDLGEASTPLPQGTSACNFRVRLAGRTLDILADGERVFACPELPAAAAGRDPRVPLNAAARFYQGTTSIMLGRGGIWSDVRVEAPAGAVQLANLSIDLFKAHNHPAARSYPDGEWKNKRLATDQPLDGRVTALPAPEGCVAPYAEAEFTVGTRRAFWITSDGTHAAAWLFTQEGVCFLNGSAIQTLPDNGTTAHLWRTELHGDVAELYRDGRLFYRTRLDARMRYDRGVHWAESELLTVEEVLSGWKGKFTQEEKNILLKGGTFIRAFPAATEDEATCGKLLRLRIIEGKR